MATKIQTEVRLKDRAKIQNSLAFSDLKTNAGGWLLNPDYTGKKALSYQANYISREMP